MNEFCRLGKDITRKATYRSVDTEVLMNFGSTASGKLLSTRTLPSFARSLWRVTSALGVHVKGVLCGIRALCQNATDEVKVSWRFKQC